MCTVSMIGDDWSRRIYPSLPTPTWPTPLPGGIAYVAEVSRAEFEALKKEVEALKELLLAAKKYDEATGQPDCHMDEKVALIKKVAEAVGINMDEVFK